MTAAGTGEFHTVCSPTSWRDRPVTVSATLITYNQEKYVADALQSVLAQTWPLDLIVADDSSKDDTWGVIQRTLKGYAGPHRVRITRAAVNLGICRNQNKALSLAEGELIVLFEGDDVSLPERVEALVEAYLARNRACAALGSAVTTMDSSGGTLRDVVFPLETQTTRNIVQGNWTVIGCGLALRRDLFFDIGPITRGLISGDIAIWMRAGFLHDGGVWNVKHPLVRYRVHPENTGSKYTLRFESRDAVRVACRQLLRNEVAQVLEMRKIGRYRRRSRQGSEKQAAELDSTFSFALDLALCRARLVFVCARRPAWKWLAPAFAALEYPSLKRQAVRTIALVLFPFASRLRRQKPRG